MEVENLVDIVTAVLGKSMEKLQGTYRHLVLRRSAKIRESGAISSPYMILGKKILRR